MTWDVKYGNGSMARVRHMTTVQSPVPTRPGPLYEFRMPLHRQPNTNTKLILLTVITQMIIMIPLPSAEASFALERTRSSGDK